MQNQNFTSAGANATWELSGWWRRAGALMIDSIVVGIPAFVIAFVVGFAFLDGSSSSGGSDADVIQLIGGGLGLLFAIAYYCIVMPATNGQTLGKMASGIRVVREDGGEITASFSFLRQILVMQIVFGWLAAVLLYVPTLLNYLWPLWDSKNQALHDKMVKSRVVRANPIELPPAEVAPQAQPQAAPAFPQAPAPGPPPPPTPGGTSTPYTPPPGFENPVPDDEKK